MKTLALILSLIFTSTCFADVVVIYNKDTKEIMTASSKDDTVVPAGYEKKILAGNLSDFTSENPTNYKLNGTKFIKNIDKIDKQEQEKIKQEENIATEKLIQAKIREQAIAELKTEGKLNDKGEIVK
jgi:hypothetical protein